MQGSRQGWEWDYQVHGLQTSHDSHRSVFMYFSKKLSCTSHALAKRQSCACHVTVLLCTVPTRYVLFTFTSHALVISLLMSCTCHATVIHLPRTSHTASTCHAPVMQFTCHSKVLYVHQHALVMYQSCTTNTLTKY